MGDEILSVDLELGAAPARLALRLRVRDLHLVVLAATAVAIVAIVFKDRTARLAARSRRPAPMPPASQADELTP